MNQTNQQKDGLRLLNEWLEDKPQIVKDLAAEFPPVTTITHEGKTYWVTGWSETVEGKGAVLLSPIDPKRHYDAAIRHARPACPDCVRKCNPKPGFPLDEPEEDKQ